jgi:hypothetical protein
MFLRQILDRKIYGPLSEPVVMSRICYIQIYTFYLSIYIKSSVIIIKKKTTVMNHHGYFSYSLRESCSKFCIFPNICHHKNRRHAGLNVANATPTSQVHTTLICVRPVLGDTKIKKYQDVAVSSDNIFISRLTNICQIMSVILISVLGWRVWQIAQYLYNYVCAFILWQPA